ncbi:MAG: alpha-2-macroglobulin family protein [Saprospiraceae bacterium]
MKFQAFLGSKLLTYVLAIGLGAILVSFTTLPGFSYQQSVLSMFTIHHLPFTIKTHPPNMIFDFDKAWREIDSLEQQGLPKSALEKTEALLAAARSEKASAQEIKALMYRGKYQSQLEEDGMPKAIFRFEEEIENAEFPVKPIMQSMLAEMYQGYLDNNYWRFQNRTQTGDFKPDDLRTWSIEQITRESAKLYWASLSDPKLKSTDIGDFKILLTEGKNEEGLRPTLFDFLAHRAVDYFMNERSYLTQPAYKFYIDNEKAFATASDFVKWKIETPDTASQKLQTLLLLQDLLDFRLSKKDNKAALLDADLKRLQFVYSNAVLDTKDAVYLKALENLQKQNEGNPAEAEVIFQIASFYNNNGAGYQVAPMGSPQVDDERKWHFKKAHDLCNTAIEKYPSSFGAKQCAVLKASILEKQLDMNTEMVNLPEQPFLAKIDYRNVPEAWFKVIRFDEKKQEEFEKLQSGRDANDRILDYFNKLKPIKSWSVKLPGDGDFRRHSVEIKMDGLPCGQYLVMVAGSNAFSKSAGAVGYLFTNVSNIGYWQRQGDEGTSIVVFDRKTGGPTKGVTGEFWVQNYNSVFRKYDWKKKGIAVSDANGFINPGLSDREDRNFRILLRNGKDTLFTQENYYNYTYNNQTRPYQQTQFFLDRGIYRPGQTVYFKGIALEFDEKRMPSILKNQAVTVSFKDANWQDVSSLQLKTNEYGTFSGQFTAPRGGLLGNMQIMSSIGGQSKSFRVEEYKRPKFEVAFEPVQGTYRLDDSVKITGNAVAYAGSNIDGAEVTWRVVREVRFPWWPWWYARWIPWRGETMEIANGVATTDATGKFNITFAALPDRSIPKDKKPEFNYTIYADVTDITGETQSNETYVAVGYISMKADVTVNGSPLGDGGLNLDSLSKLELVTQNLAGQFEPVQGTVKIDLLASPKQVYLNRYWEQPDRQVLGEKEFKQNFSKFAWGNENEPQNWPVLSTILEQKFDTKTSKEVMLPKAKMTTGWYALTMTTTDKYGEKVEVKKYFSTYDLDEKKLPAPAIGWHILEKPTWQPGETAPLYFGTSEKNLSVLLEMEKDGKTISRKWLKVSDLLKENYAIKESDRGNVSYIYSWAMYNRTANNASVIQVPWSNKDLTIEYGTFRDKLLPGQKEEWIVKIKGPKGEKVAAEMVAGMYDASLDAFAPNSWGLGVWPTSWTRIRYNAGGYQAIQENWLSYHLPPTTSEGDYRQYRSLNWFNWYFNDYGGRMYMAKSRAGHDMADGMVTLEMASAPAPTADMAYAKEEAVVANGAVPTESQAGSGGDAPLKKPETDLSQVQVRTNLNETVFFFPHLMTDAEGNVVIKFTMNEALTRWKFLGLATTPDLKIGTTMKEVVTQKDLMVLPNPPRFFRENDEIEFTAKVSNLTEKTLAGEARLELVNALTGEKLDWSKITKVPQTINFTAEGKQSARLAWRFKVPDITDVPVIEHTVIAAAGEFSDAERSAAPVLSNRMLVTETMPLPVRGNETKTFTLNSLKNNTSNTLRNEGLTLEFTQNPAWYAVQALPYLMEYPYECTEQIFSRYYANSLATSVANSHPKVKAVFDKWRQYEPEALKSNLSKNEELKTALLEETPWVLAAQSEEQQKQNIALLFDLNRMAYEQEAALKKLQDRQLPGGGWAWFPGDRDSWYITQYVVEGLGHLQKLGVQDLENNPAAWQMVEKAVRYCDARMVEHYEDLEDMVKNGKAKWEDDHMDYLVSHYLYTRSFFLEDKSAQASTGKAPLGAGGKRYIALDGKISQVHDYYMGQAEKYWLNKGLYTEGMLSLALSRTGKATVAVQIVRSLKERSLNNDELGMYWKYPTGWWWYQAPIETHSLMIEVFNDVANDAKAVDDLKVWLLKNKQTNNWKTTKATSEAVYALLSSGDNWLLEDQPLKISLPNAANSKLEQQVKTAQQTAEAGTGYFKTRIPGENVTKDMATIKVQNPNKVVAWGAMYWQYFEQLDKIKTFEETPLTIKKQLFRVENSATGEVLKPIKEGETLKVGEKLKVRIELRVDRDMEYVHMKDMRASGFEPINVLSQYKWQGGLGYYESTRDASTNFFFSYLPKGTHVFEYPLRVTYNGDFSNGVTTIQCMYAPEFTSHSEGIRVQVK